MFTGIVEATGEVVGRKEQGSNIQFSIKSSLAGALKIDQSVAHNGVCLTVTAHNEDVHQVVAVKETLNKSSLGKLKIGDWVNLERSLSLQSLMDGHLVQGHVDDVVQCIDISETNGSWYFRFKGLQQPQLVVPKGSVCINGVSLTVVDPVDDEFSVAIIPYTFDNTTFRDLSKGDEVNIEYDVVGKYLYRFFQMQRP